jgi:hypothetical protein
MMIQRVSEQGPDLLFRRRPDKSAGALNARKGGPQGERSESSRKIKRLAPVCTGVMTCSGFPWIDNCFFMPALMTVCQTVDYPCLS